MLDRADVVLAEARVHVDSGDALVVAGRTGGVGRGQGRAALLEVPGLVAALGRRRDGQREYAVGVAVAVAGVGVSTPVTRGPHEDRALALATLQTAAIRFISSVAEAEIYLCSRLSSLASRRRRRRIHPWGVRAAKPNKTRQSDAPYSLSLSLRIRSTTRERAFRPPAEERRKRSGALSSN